MTSAPTGETRPTRGDLAQGEVVFAHRYPVTRLDLVRYAGASGDFNRIHWDADAAAAAGLSGVIAHGMYTMAVAAGAVSDWAGDPGRVTAFSVRFTKPVLVPVQEGTTLEVSAKVGAIDDTAGTVRLDLTVASAGVTVLGKARAVVALP